MLDTGRSFYDINTLKKLIESMMISKFNVFHWHITDGDSFPLEIKGLPINSEKYYS